VRSGRDTGKEATWQLATIKGLRDQARPCRDRASTACVDKGTKTLAPASVTLKRGNACPAGDNAGGGGGRLKFGGAKKYSGAPRVRTTVSRAKVFPVYSRGGKKMSTNNKERGKGSSILVNMASNTEGAVCAGWEPYLRRSKKPARRTIELQVGGGNRTGDGKIAIRRGAEGLKWGKAGCFLGYREGNSPLHRIVEKKKNQERKNLRRCPRSGRKTEKKVEQKLLEKDAFRMRSAKGFEIRKKRWKELPQRQLPRIEGRKKSKSCATTKETGKGRALPIPEGKKKKGIWNGGMAMRVKEARGCPCPPWQGEKVGSCPLCTRGKVIAANVSDRYRSEEMSIVKIRVRKKRAVSITLAKSNRQQPNKFKPGDGRVVGGLELNRESIQGIAGKTR